ncbi:MAG: hypothetical protein ACXW6V_22660, partial [Candidatus Binatia bacterium]
EPKGAPQRAQRGAAATEARIISRKDAKVAKVAKVGKNGEVSLCYYLPFPSDLGVLCALARGISVSEGI